MPSIVGCGFFAALRLSPSSSERQKSQDSVLESSDGVEGDPWRVELSDDPFEFIDSLVLFLEHVEEDWNELFGRQAGVGLIGFVGVGPGFAEEDAVLASEKFLGDLAIRFFTVAQNVDAAFCRDRESGEERL